MPVNAVRLQEVKEFRDAIDKHRNVYKWHKKRIDFLEKVINKCGKDHLISHTEVNRCKLDVKP